MELELLVLKCDIAEPREQIITRYLGGLKEEIFNMVWLQPYQTFNYMRKLVLNMKKQQKKVINIGWKSAYKEGSLKFLMWFGCNLIELLIM